MKIQGASEDFAEEGIMFLSSKTTYIEENTLKGEETSISAPGTHSELPRRMDVGARHMTCTQTQEMGR